MGLRTSLNSLSLRSPLAAPLVWAVAATGLVSSGCRFGEAHFDGSIQGRTFDPTGTVFAYVDAHDDNLVEDRRPRVAVAMTWIAFNPAGDLNDLDGAALEGYGHELRLRDTLSLVFDDQGALKAGDMIESERDGDVASANQGFTAIVHLAPERLDGNSRFDDFKPFGGKRKTTVTLTTVDFLSDTQVLAGDIDIDFQTSASDPSVTRQGSYKGTFRAPLVPERTAESNLALLDVEDVMGLPLGPRRADNTGSGNDATDDTTGTTDTTP